MFNHFLKWQSGVGVLAVMLGACAASSRPQSPATEPSSFEIRLSDSVPLASLTSEDREANLTDKLTKPQAAQTIYFGEIAETDDDDNVTAAFPILAVHADDVWSATVLAGEGLADAGWKYVAAGPAPREIWGALDTVAGDSRANFVLAHSTDGGKTFGLTVIRKPCKLASFFDFAMDRNGKGRATLSLDSDFGRFKAGLYHYTTTDDGKTWSHEPTFEPDVMIPADQVPDEEQPDQPEMKSQT